MTGAGKFLHPRLHKLLRQGGESHIVKVGRHKIAQLNFRPGSRCKGRENDVLNKERLLTAS